MGSGGKNRGRPVEVEGGRRCSILFGRRELRILAAAEKAALSYRDNVSMSATVRTMVRIAGTEHGDEVQELVKKDMAIVELQRRLDQEERLRKQAEKDAAAARSKAKGTESVLQRLLRHLPLVRQKAAADVGTPSGIPLLDQVWHNQCLRSWPRLLVRLEQAQRDQGGGT